MLIKEVIIISKELENICENCSFDSDFQEFLEGMENHYDLIRKQKANEETLTMVSWILEGTNIEELKCLSEKERFLFGLGVLMSEMEYC